jgi:general secretion pathway protein F
MAQASLTLDDLIALNQEIAALARAGAPLEAGLRDFARESHGNLAQVADQLGGRLAEGKSLADSAAELPGVPPVYVAIVEAGVRAGRLPAALEGLAEAARRMARLRRAAGLALAYPVSVLLMAYFLLLLFVLNAARVLAASMGDAKLRAGPVFEVLSRAGPVLREWWWAPPVALLLLIAVWWRVTSRSLVLEPRVGLRWLGWMPLFGRLQRSSQLAVFSHTLALLVGNHRPLGESIVLAAQATGSRRLTRLATQARQEIDSGAPPGAALRRCGLPPLICWLLGASNTEADLARTLQELADDYQQRAVLQAERIRVLLPVLLTAGVAGTAVALYGLVLFLPWTMALRELAAP